MGIKKFLLMFSLLCLFAIGGITVDAANKHKPIEIMVFYGEVDPATIILEDGSKLTDYDYNITTMMTPRFYPLGDYFDYVAWINRDNVISLQLKPNNTTRTNNTAKNNAWRTLASTTHGVGGHSYWKNTQVMEWQFECHYNFAKNKDFWNLEPHRTAPSYVAVVAAGCNP